MASGVIASYGGSILDTLGVDFDQIITQFFLTQLHHPFTITFEEPRLILSN
jgi:hypothetical protein